MNNLLEAFNTLRHELTKERLITCNLDQPCWTLEESDEDWERVCAYCERYRDLEIRVKGLEALIEKLQLLSVSENDWLLQHLSISAWCLKQVSDKHKGVLSQDKIYMLDRINFSWDHYTNELTKLGYNWERNKPKAQVETPVSQKSTSCQ